MTRGPCKGVKRTLSPSKNIGIKVAKYESASVVDIDDVNTDNEEKLTEVAAVEVADDVEVPAVLDYVDEERMLQKLTALEAGMMKFEKRIKELEEENERLKNAVGSMEEKLTSNGF